MTRTLFHTLALALVLAALLTTGGGNLALAADITGNVDPTSPGAGMLHANVSAVGQGTATLNTNDLLQGSNGQLTLGSVTYSIALDALDFVGANNVTGLTIDNNSYSVNLAGNGGALLTSNGQAITDVSLTGCLQLGSTTSQSLGGSLVNLKLNSSNQANMALTVRGGAFEITGSLMVANGDITVGASGDAFSASLHVNNLQMADNFSFGGARITALTAAGRPSAASGQSAARICPTPP